MRQFFDQWLLYPELYPLETYLVLLALAIVTAKLLPFFRLMPVRWIKAHAEMVLTVLSAGAIISYLACVGLYAASPFYSDHVEPNVTTVSWLYTQGSDVYHPVDSPFRYSIQYGPMLYVINGLLLKVLGPGIAVSKIGGVAAGLFGFAMAMLAFRTVSAWTTAFRYAGLLAACLLFFNIQSFWLRPDSFLFCCSSLALWAALLPRSRGFAAAFLFGASIGVATNMKAHALLYLVPALVLFQQRHGNRKLALIAVISVLAVISPFFDHRISMVNLLRWLKATSRHGLDASMFFQNWKWVLFLSLPLTLSLLAWWRMDRQSLVNVLQRQKMIVGASFLCLFLLTIVASKPGAGVHHLIPFLPVVLFASLRANQLRKSACASGESAWLLRMAGVFVLCLALQTVSFAKDYLPGYFELSRRAKVEKDIDEILRTFPEARVAMGVAGNRTYITTFYRPLLAFRGHGLLIDPAALMDMKFAGLSVPQATFEKLASGEIGIWLIPKGEEPFTLDGYNGTVMFDEMFRQNFFRYYELRAASFYFDLWFHKKL